jgi:hypothetical protein
MATGESASDEPPWESGYLDDGYNFAKRCAIYRDGNPYEQPALEAIMIYLATELWDRGFSQTEIKSAFQAAVKCLVPYAAGEERRGQKG